MKDYDIRECSNEEADFVIDKLVEYNLEYLPKCIVGTAYI